MAKNACPSGLILNTSLQYINIFDHILVKWRSNTSGRLQTIKFLHFSDSWLYCVATIGDNEMSVKSVFITLSNLYWVNRTYANVCTRYIHDITFVEYQSYILEHLVLGVCPAHGCGILFYVPIRSDTFKHVYYVTQLSTKLQFLRVLWLHELVCKYTQTIRDVML